jgi:hypothetical protein
VSDEQEGTVLDSDGDATEGSEAVASEAVDSPSVESDPGVHVPEVLPDEQADAELIAAAGAPIELPNDETDELPEDLRAVSEMLEQPTGEIMAVTAAAVAADNAARVSDGAEGAEPAAEGDANGAEPVAEGVEGAEPAAEGEHALDEIEPGTVAAADSEAATQTEGDEDAALEVPGGNSGRVPWWPFVAYVVLWLAAAAYAVWQLQQLPGGTAAYETDFYRYGLFAGLGLLVAGPVLLLVVWIATWIARKSRPGALFVSALWMGATATLVGALIWMGAIMLVDYLRLGRPF